MSRPGAVVTHDPFMHPLPPGEVPHHLKTHLARDPAAEAHHLALMNRREQLQREQELRERIAAVKAKAKS